MQESSLSPYMHLSQREASADVVNASVLTASSAQTRPLKAQAQNTRSSLPQVKSPVQASWQCCWFILLKTLSLWLGIVGPL